MASEISRIETGGVSRPIKDETARNDNLILHQQDNRIYKGRNLVTVFASEIAKYSDEWAWIRARIKAANYEGIYVGDYIPVTMNKEVVNMQVAGIDTYYNTTDQPVGHHIDFISKDCFTETIQWNTTNNNNGNSESPYPYMVSNLKKWLDETLYGYLPDKVKNQIAHKRMLLEQRYSSAGALTDSTGWGWQDLGALWVPLEYEVFGAIVWGTPGWSEGQAVQYPIFANTYLSRIKAVVGATGGWLLSGAAIRRVRAMWAAMGLPTAGMRLIRIVCRSASVSLRKQQSHNPNNRGPLWSPYLLKGATK